MYDAVKEMLESEFFENFDTETENVLEFTDLEQLTESQVQLTGFIPAKVIVLKEEETGNIFVEYANNVERLMEDQKLNFDEAMEQIAEHYEISTGDMNVIVSESDITKININELTDKYKFVRK